MTSDTRQCYFPNGNKAPGNVPCKADTNTHCCGQSDICLDNGLCLNVGHQPTCFLEEPARMINGTGVAPFAATPSMGASITNVGFSSGKATYCCGSPRTNGSTVICLASESDNNSDVPFSIQDGNPILSAGMLQNITTLDATNSSSSDSNSNSNSSTATPATCPSSHDTAIGAGVGVPLGVIAILLLIWALYERRRASRALQQMQPVAFEAGHGAFGHAPAAPYMNTTDMAGRPPVELEHHQPVSELMGKDAGK
ncbi:hypothetical protein ANOM_000190 [Aspergillus nomiae NRRL 13137]|uniref:Mid2 domain-containing protein n=1 Tax=Aspergillus nomiae NRRL (strain ATCC 15546 / NRRL 13137 / CBS 260.88 / M93) TaxID=1509407 RepID=A0A0L1JIU5_ASPN3|nr:uncharacterized protein ANOM_000190 [Aspergillus nomiae NRRL 13137]KNG91689.1 hypothetical protein ANOM_000190 [Aspergillus nomiae NRRL 13137]